MDEREKLPKSLIKYGNEVVGVSNLIFSNNPDYDLMLLELDRMQTIDPVAFENQIYAIHSNDYLNNIGKINCARALRSTLIAKKLYEIVGFTEQVHEFITDAGYFLGMAREQYESVTVKSKSNAKKAHAEDNSISDFAIEHYLLELEKRGKYPKAQAAKDMAGKIVNLTESTLERKTLTPKSIEEYKQRKSKSTPC